MRTEQSQQRVKFLLWVFAILLAVTSLEIGIFAGMGLAKQNHDIVIALGMIDAVSIIAFTLLWGMEGR